MRSATPASCTARTESPPPTTVKPSQSASARATANVPSAKRGHSKTPIGPFQKTVRAAGDPRGEVLARARPDVEAEPARRAASSNGTTSRLGVGVERRRPRRRRSAAPTSNENGFSLADLLGHLAADQHRVRARAEVLEHADLVVDLRAAGDDHERPLDVAEQRAEVRAARRAAAGRRRPAAGARRPRSRRARGAPSRTRR